MQCSAAAVVCDAAGPAAAARREQGSPLLPPRPAAVACWPMTGAPPACHLTQALVQLTLVPLQDVIQHCDSGMTWHQHSSSRHITSMQGALQEKASCC